MLVQVPRGGYLPVAGLRRLPDAGPLPGLPGAAGDAANQGTPACAWCGHRAVGWQCAACGGTRTRALVVGARRTAEELGRAFPQVPVRTSGRDGVLAAVGPEPALVIATPGAEPVADGGYAAALLLDGWALLDPPDLRAGEEALRRWLAAAALVRPAGAGGLVVVARRPGQPRGAGPGALGPGGLRRARARRPAASRGCRPRPGWPR